VSEMTRETDDRSKPPPGFTIMVEREVVFYWEARLDGELVESDGYAREVGALKDAWREHDARAAGGSA
jgi:hypothetical protein